MLIFLGFKFQTTFLGFIFQTCRGSAFKFEINGIQDSGLGLHGPDASTVYFLSHREVSCWRMLKTPGWIMCQQPIFVNWPLKSYANPRDIILLTFENCLYVCLFLIYSAVYGPTGTKLDNHTIRWLTVCMCESQGGKPIGKALVCIKIVELNCRTGQLLCDN